MKFIPGHGLYKSIILFWTCLALFTSCNGKASYENVTKIFEDKLGSQSVYNTKVRPIRDQTDVLNVSVKFTIMSIVEIDAIKQQFTVNAFFNLFWVDEILTWNSADYEDTKLIHPDPNQIWRPRLFLGNTIGDRDLFADDYSPVDAAYDGNMSWSPGSVFPASCKLDLRKYPFDTQYCYIEMFSIGLKPSEIKYYPLTGKVVLDLYVKSGEWEVDSTSIVSSDASRLASFRINFVLKRLPGFFVVNIITPIVLMSFLNILVFLIPVESGEKIGYGITVLLALTVFMSIVSDQVPRSSDTLPLMTVYLLVQTVLSVCTVMVTIAIVFCHHRMEKETKRHKATSTFKNMFSKIRIMNRGAPSSTQVNPIVDSDQSSEHKNDSLSVPEKTDDVVNIIRKMKVMSKPVPMEKPPMIDVETNSDYVNRWKQVGKHVNSVSFLVFLGVWLSVTIGFLSEISG